MSYIKIVLMGSGLLFAANSLAMDYAAKKLQTWKRGETIAGEDFVAATEEVADFASKLQHPTDPFKYMTYLCQIKYREIIPTVYINTPGQPSLRGYTRVQTVYAIKDCVLVD